MNGATTCAGCAASGGKRQLACNGAMRCAASCCASCSHVSAHSVPRWCRPLVRRCCTGWVQLQFLLADVMGCRHWQFCCGCHWQPVLLMQVAAMAGGTQNVTPSKLDIFPLILQRAVLPAAGPRRRAMGWSGWKRWLSLAAAASAQPWASRWHGRTRLARQVDACVLPLVLGAAWQSRWLSRRHCNSFGVLAAAAVLRNGADGRVLHAVVLLLVLLLRLLVKRMAPPAQRTRTYQPSSSPLPPMGAMFAC